MLTLYIFSNPLFAQCSNGGISSRCTKVTLIGSSDETGPLPTDDAPAVILDSHVSGSLRIVPAVKDADGFWRKAPGHWMAGGAFIGCSDSRFSERCRRLLGGSFYGAVAFHDRQER